VQICELRQQSVHLFRKPQHSLPRTFAASPARLQFSSSSLTAHFPPAQESPFMNLKIAAFVFGAALSWGVYVPIVHEATSRLGSNLRAFILVGAAYFLVAVLVPTILLMLLKADPTAKFPDKLNWNSTSVIWGLLAGMSGALGALCVIFATRDAVAAMGPTVGPLLVAPLVFAGAPIINTISSLTIFAHGKKFEAPGPFFFLGLLMAAGGMVLVMVYKPKTVGGPTGGAPAAAKAPAAPGKP
jgi:hypothetical protein